MLCVLWIDGHQLKAARRSRTYRSLFLNSLSKTVHAFSSYKPLHVESTALTLANFVCKRLFNVCQFASAGGPSEMGSRLYLRRTSSKFW
jgi:hypothetical protein